MMAASFPKEMTPAESAGYYRTKSRFVNQVTSRRCLLVLHTFGRAARPPKREQATPRTRLAAFAADAWYQAERFSTPVPASRRR